MNWIKGRPQDIDLMDTRLFLWDIEKETATVGEFTFDEEHGYVVYAYGDYFKMDCFSHYALIEPPTQ